MQVGFTILGKPRGKERARTVFKYGKNRTYTPYKTVVYESNIRECYQKTIRYKFAKGVPLKVNVIAFYSIPKSVNKTVKKMMLNGDILPSIKPDCDNVIKNKTKIFH